MAHRFRTIAVLLSVALPSAALLLGLTGCTATSTPPLHQAWSNRMTDLLVDDKGQGAAGGEITPTNGDKSASSLVELGGIHPGRYDILAVCRGAGVVQFWVKSTTTKAGAPIHTKVLAHADIACGATLRLPFTQKTSHVVFEAKDANTEATWEAAIVPPGWQPSPTIYG